MVFFAAVIWSLIFPFAKVGLDYASPLCLTTYKLLFSASVMYLFALGERQASHGSRLKTNFFLAVLGNAIPCSLFITAGIWLPSHQIGILSAMTPILTACCTQVFCGGVVIPAKALFLGLVGVGFLAFQPFTEGDTDQTFLFGLLCMFGTTLSTGLSFVVHRESGERIRALDLGHQLLFATVLVGFASLLFESWTWLNLQGLLLAAAMGLFTAFGWKILYDYNEEQRNPTATSLVCFFYPVFGCLFGWFLLGENISFLSALGSFTVLLSILFIPRGVAVAQPEVECSTEL